jgi:hypothetical protein
MSTLEYQEVLHHVQRLTSAEQLRLLEELAALIRHQGMLRPPRSILELQGLGKEIWSDVDAQEYIDAERATWNG